MDKYQWHLSKVIIPLERSYIFFFSIGTQVASVFVVVEEPEPCPPTFALRNGDCQEPLPLPCPFVVVVVVVTEGMVFAGQSAEPDPFGVRLLR